MQTRIYLESRVFISWLIEKAAAATPPSFPLFRRGELVVHIYIYIYTRVSYKRETINPVKI